MSDKENFDIPSDDSEYDDALDESFEFDDDDYDDVDLDSELGDFEDDYDDVDYEEEGQIDQEAVDNFQPKKSKISFNTIVIAGAIVVGIFVVMSQMQPEPPEYGDKVEKSKFTTALKLEGHNKGPGAIEKEDIESLEVPSEGKPEAKQEQGFLFDAEVADVSKEVVDDAPPMPSPIVSETNEVDEVSDVNNDTNIDDALVKSVESEETEVKEVPRSPFGENNGEQKIEDLEETAVVNEDKVFEALEEAKLDQEVVVESVPVMVPEKPDTAIVVEDLQGKIEDVPDKVIEPEVVSESIQSTSLNEKLDRIIQRLDDMELKINDLQTASIEKTENTIVNIDVPKQSAPKKTADKKADVEKESAIEAPQNEEIAQPKAAVAKKITKKAPARVTWELRAAQPGKAWVSKKGQRDMRPVVVGDKLSGIGRIQNILYSNGKWTVQGASGKITQ